MCSTVHQHISVAVDEPVGNSDPVSLPTLGAMLSIGAQALKETLKDRTEMARLEGFLGPRDKVNSVVLGETVLDAMRRDDCARQAVNTLARLWP